MEKMKILIFAILLSAGLLFNGELYMLYLNNFQESCYQANFYTDIPAKAVFDDQIVQDFVRTGEKHDVDFFVVNQNIRSAYKTETTVYGTRGALRYLSSMGIKEGTSKSLFFGEAAVHCGDFQDIEDVTKFDTYYFVGDESKLADIRAFKADLIDQYSGGFPKLMGSERETWLNLLTVWGIIFGLMLLMTLYAILYYKKETMVRIILGESLIGMFAKNILTDTAAFCLLLLVMPQILKNFTNVQFRMPFILLLSVIFLAVNFLLNAMILRINYKKDIAGGHDGRGLLRASYLLKVVTAVLVTLVIAGNVVVIREAYNLYQQKDFFESHKDYSYYQTNYKIDNRLGKTGDDDAAMNQEFYQRFQDKAVIYADLTGNLRDIYPVVLNNAKAMEEIKAQCPPIERAVNTAAEDQIYILIPSFLSKNTQEYEYAKEVAYYYFGQNGYEEAKIMAYDGNISVTGIHRHNEYETVQYKSPIILFNNTVSKAGEEGNYPDWLQPYDIMYHISTEEWQSFIDEYWLEDQIIGKSNVLDVYNHNWSKTARNMRMLLVLSAFLLLLEMALIMLIIRLEYQFNAVEMVVKKVHGYTLLNRNRRILKTTVFSSLVGIITALVLSNALEMPGGVPLILSGLLLLVLELGYILWRAKKTEKTTISSILKGERI